MHPSLIILVCMGLCATSSSLQSDKCVLGKNEEHGMHGDNNDIYAGHDDDSTLSSKHTIRTCD